MCLKHDGLYTSCMLTSGKNLCHNSLDCYQAQFFYCSCLRLHPHVTVTIEALSRKCTWTQNYARSSVVLKCKQDPLFTQQFLVGIAEKRIRSKVTSHISLNFLHLIIQKEKQNWVHILFYSLIVDMKGRKEYSVLWLTCILLHTQKISSMRESEHQNT